METSFLTLVTSAWVTLVQVLFIFLWYAILGGVRDHPLHTHRKEGREDPPPSAMRVAPPAPLGGLARQGLPPDSLLPSLAPASLSIRPPRACGGGSFPRRGPCGARIYPTASPTSPLHLPAGRAGLRVLSLPCGTCWDPPTLWPRPPKMELEESSGLHRPLEPTILHTGVKLWVYSSGPHTGAQVRSEAVGMGARRLGGRVRATAWRGHALMGWLHRPCSRVLVGGWVCELPEDSPGFQTASAFWVAVGLSRVCLQRGTGPPSLPSGEGPWRAHLHLLEHSRVMAGPWSWEPSRPASGRCGVVNSQQHHRQRRGAETEKQFRRSLTT